MSRNVYSRVLRAATGVPWVFAALLPMLACETNTPYSSRGIVMRDVIEPGVDRSGPPTSPQVNDGSGRRGAQDSDSAGLLSDGVTRPAVFADGGGFTLALVTREGERVRLVSLGDGDAIPREAALRFGNVKTFAQVEGVADQAMVVGSSGESSGLRWLRGVLNGDKHFFLLPSLNPWELLKIAETDNASWTSIQTAGPFKANMFQPGFGAVSATHTDGHVADIWFDDSDPYLLHLGDLSTGTSESSVQIDGNRPARGVFNGENLLVVRAALEGIPILIGVINPGLFDEEWFLAVPAAQVVSS